YGNETLVGRRDIDFRRPSGTSKVEACLTLEMVQQLGVDIGKLQASGKLSSDDPDACLDLPALIDHASVRYDMPRLRLMVSVPQSAMARGRRGYVDPALWDEGVRAAFINYQLSSNRSSTRGESTLSNNVGLRNGLNLGAWRLRNESNFSSSTGRPSIFKSNRSYLQHDVTALKGQFSAGDIFSD
ncbi:fimbrial biogenesis outer membrane usher protein, partial [Pseudomonas sp. MWU13-2625]